MFQQRKKTTGLDLLGFQHYEGTPLHSYFSQAFSVIPVLTGTSSTAPTMAASTFFNSFSKHRVEEFSEQGLGQVRLLSEPTSPQHLVPEVQGPADVACKILLEFAHQRRVEGVEDG